MKNYVNKNFRTQFLQGSVTIVTDPKWNFLQIISITFILVGTFLLFSSIIIGLQQLTKMNIKNDYKYPISEKQNLSSFDYIFTDTQGYVYCFQDGVATNIYNDKGEFIYSYRIMWDYAIGGGNVDIIKDNICIQVGRYGKDLYQYKYGKFKYYITWEKNDLIVYDSNDNICFKINMGKDSKDLYEPVLFYDNDDETGLLLSSDEGIYFVNENRKELVNEEDNYFNRVEKNNSEAPNKNIFKITKSRWNYNQKLQMCNTKGEVKILDKINIKDKPLIIFIYKILGGCLLIYLGIIINRFYKTRERYEVV